MVLVQLAQTTTAYTQHNVNLYGPCKIKILDILYLDTLGGGAGNHLIIKMSSSVFNTRNSSAFSGNFVAVNNSILFSNKADHKQISSPEALEFDAVVNGFIDITLTQMDNTAIPAGFVGAVITLDIIPIVKEADQEGMRYKAIKYSSNLQSIN